MLSRVRQNNWRTGRNLVENSIWAGAYPATNDQGSAGRWVKFYLPDVNNGVTSLMNETGVDFNNHPYVQWRVLSGAGGPSISGSTWLFFTYLDNMPPVNPFDGVTMSCDIREIAGNKPFNLSLGINQWGDRQGSNYIATNLLTIQNQVTTSNYQRFSLSIVGNAGMNFAECGIGIGYQAGVQFDYVINVSRPQIERGLQLSQYEPRLKV